MRRLIRFLLGRYDGFGFRYEGDLPCDYPAPGSEFYYNGKRGTINFYCVYIDSDGERAELLPVVYYAGRDDLVYTLDMIRPDLKVNVVV